MRRTTGYTVTLKGGPLDGETRELPWETIKREKLEAPGYSGGLIQPFKRAFYVPCPTEPDTVWRFDARRSDTGIKLGGAKVCRVTEVTDEPGALFGISVPQVPIEAVMDAIHDHYNEFGQAPESFKFPEGAAFIVEDDSRRRWWGR